ncbi:uncharacterized protein LOC127855158 isoform X2 [Dreissena polymorpha]|uniref:uncharacterized protein LOC127855158 isoform X2 n=1 Tax=Dreissena polymorpha TaxID=45954 RepID=UPI002265043B|nr:uncharacterized protein LOC127855158 isoform X2 [Dreissena polymorpha]
MFPLFHRALAIWMFLSQGLLPIIKGNLLSNFQEFAMLNSADTNTSGSTDTFPSDAFPPDNVFPENNDFPPTDVNLPGQLPFPSDFNVPNPDLSGFNQGLPIGNSFPSNATDNEIGSISPITTVNNGGSMFPTETNDLFVTPLGTPLDRSVVTPSNTVNKPKPTVDSKVNFFLPWIPKGSSFVNKKDGSTQVFQPSDNWMLGEPVGQANFGVNVSPAKPVSPTVSNPGPVFGSMPVNAISLNPKPITSIQLPIPIGPVDQLPSAEKTFNPGKPVANTGMHIKPIQLPKPIGPIDHLPLATVTNFKPGKPIGTMDISQVNPIKTGVLPLGTVGIPTGSKPIVDTISEVGTIILSGQDLKHGINDILMPNGNNLADQWVGDIYKGRPRPVVVEVTEAPITVSPACEVLGQISLKTMGRDKEEYAKLRKQCAQERKEARLTLKEQKQLFKEQKQLLTAAKQGENKINQAVRQEQKAIKREERQNNIAAKQEQKAVLQEQPAAKKEEKAALKAFKQDQKGAVPMGTVDFDTSGGLVAHMTLPDKTIFVGKKRRGNPRRNRRAPGCSGQDRELGLCMSGPVQTQSSGKEIRVRRAPGCKGKDRKLGLCTPDAVAPLSPACEALAQMTLNTTEQQDKQEFARLTQQCAEESKQTLHIVKEQKQQLKAQVQIMKAVKQEEKALRQEQRATKQLEKAVKQAERAEQKAERAALKALKQEQKAVGARPIGSIDLSIDQVQPDQLLKLTPVDIKVSHTPSPILDLSLIENIPGFGNIDWGSKLETIPGLGIIDWSG